MFEKLLLIVKLNKFMIEFTREKIEKLKVKDKEVLDALEFSSELLRTAQDQHGHVKVKIQREGKEIELIQKTLWDEVFVLGEKCDAGEKLKELHPQVFEAYQVQRKLAQDYKKFTVTEFGFISDKMTIGNYIQMTEDIIDLKMKEAVKDVDLSELLPEEKHE